MGKGSSAPAQRNLTRQELDLLSQQRASLQQATEVASAQFNLSNEDREYISRVYRGDLDPDDPKVQKEVQRRLESLPKPTPYQFKSRTNADGSFDYETYAYERAVAQWEADKESLTRKVANELGTKGIDEILFDAVKSSGGEVSKILGDWEQKAGELGKTYTDTLTGISDRFRTKLEETSAKIGTADEGVYARTKAQNLAGISQSYAEAVKQSQGMLARRGLAGSGVEAGTISALYGQEATQKAQALGQSYNQAVQQSDAMRQQQLGIAGQIAQSDASTAGDVYQAQLGLATSGMQNKLAGVQQNLANLQMASGVSQGVFGMSQNYLSGAGATASNAASTSGQTAVGIGNMQSNYQSSMYSANQERQGAIFGGIAGAASTIGGAALLSDERLKTNIVKVGESNGYNIYTWDWIEGHDYGYNTGVLAQEVMEINPEAVVVMDNGYYGVNYNMLGV